MRRAVIVALLLAAAADAAAQDSAAQRRPIIIEVRAGRTEMLGYTARVLIGPGDAVGLTGATRLSAGVDGWFSADYRPLNSSALYRGRDLSPAVSLYALTVGVSRLLGPAQGRARVRPVEVGLGAGATQTGVEWRGYNSVTGPPPAAEVEQDPRSAGLLSSHRWHATAAARLRLVVPVGRVARLSATGALAATPVGDVRLWSGGWEPTGEGGRYRPSVQTWRYGTIVSMPLTLGLGAEF